MAWAFHTTSGKARWRWASPQGDKIYFDGVGYGVRIGALGANEQKIIDIVFNSVKRDARGK